MPEPLLRAVDILDALARGAASERCALVTLTDCIGSGPRRIGSQIAVFESGRAIGSLSSDCLEAAIVAEAQDAIRVNTPRITRFGQGSSYIDLRLACGGGMDLLFLPDPSRAVLREAAALLRRRAPIRLELSRSGAIGVQVMEAPLRAEWCGDTFRVCYPPSLRLLVAGNGPETLAMMRLATAYGADLEVLSARAEIVKAARLTNLPATTLRSLSDALSIEADRWSAILLLFHDHDWEAEILQRAIRTDAFWIGAMGSSQARSARRDALAARGIGAEQMQGIRGPIGLIPSARDPITLALSALGEIVGAYEDQISFRAGKGSPGSRDDTVAAEIQS